MRRIWGQTLWLLSVLLKIRPFASNFFRARGKTERFRAPAPRLLRALKDSNWGLSGASHRNVGEQGFRREHGLTRGTSRRKKQVREVGGFFCAMRFFVAYTKR